MHDMRLYHPVIEPMPPPNARRLAAFAVDVAVVPGIPLAIAAAVVDGPGWAWLAAALVLGPLLWTLLLATARTTPGKAIAGLTVTRVDGSRLTPRDAVRRELVGRGATHALLLAGGAGVVGYLAGLTGPGREAWHDRHAGTRVGRRPTAGTSSRAPTPSLAPAFGAGATTPAGAIYATYPERVGAFLIDTAFAITIWITLFGALALATGATDPDRKQPAWLGLAALAAYLIVVAGYHTLSIAWFETTIGKNAVGLVVRRIDGSRAGMRGAVMREVVGRTLVVGLVGSLTLSVLPLVSYLFPLWDGERQTLHDKIGATVVVRGVGERRGPRRRRRARPAPESW
jgi:uncharacterized RDD family membrane protein YckC